MPLLTHNYTVIRRLHAIRYKIEWDFPKNVYK